MDLLKQRRALTDTVIYYRPMQESERKNDERLLCHSPLFSLQGFPILLKVGHRNYKEGREPLRCAD